MYMHFAAIGFKLNTVSKEINKFTIIYSNAFQQACNFNFAFSQT